MGAPKEQSWLDAPEWRDRAACIGMDPRYFFNDEDEPPRNKRHPEEHLYGLVVCQTCEVKRECLEEAVKDPSLDFGIRGGLTTAQRRSLRRKRKGLSSVSSLRGSRLF